MIHQGGSHPNYGVIDLAKCLELAMYQGKDKDVYTGRQLGAKTPDPRTFKNINDVMDAYLAQVRFFAEKICKISNIGHYFYTQYLQRPFTSAAIFDGCVERGKDCTQWEHCNVENILMCGSSNTANSLAVIKKFVFDEKIISMEELIDACKNNFEGKEDLRQRLTNEAPKFGNDDDYVDMIAREVHLKSNEEFMNFKDYFGFPLILDGSIAGGYFGFSIGCGALPDGKKDSEPCADAVMSPSAGTDKRGPTAVIKSVSKVIPTYAHLFNQKFLPQYLEGDNKKLFAQYLRTWADLGCWHVQFNVVNRDTLLDAQKHPENYSNLVVRVAGYSAYFVELSKEIQDDIIRRTEQSF
jgi:formate C-acetyltransferase